MISGRANLVDHFTMSAIYSTLCCPTHALCTLYTAMPSLSITSWWYHGGILDAPPSHQMLSLMLNAPTCTGFLFLSLDTSTTMHRPHLPETVLAAQQLPSQA
ncbi:hypothetical protein P3342_000869 [Pyrenophora teres f. teres]|nr:hypothetical protein P3342_000869 [Pyrenophora teres f. teres]